MTTTKPAPRALLSRQIGISSQYLAKLEAVQRPRVSPRVFAAVLTALAIEDRRAITPARPMGG